MSSFPDFSEQGYEIKRILGKNSTSGRVTYLATHTTTQTPVVIKQFQFATVGATWSDYDAYQQEMQVLQQLHHPSIPAISIPLKLHLAFAWFRNINLLPR
jgi:serine/threonine protein kinase